MTTRSLLRSTLLLPLLSGVLAASCCALEVKGGIKEPRGAAGDEETAQASPSMQNALTRYQIALDQLASGHLPEARVLLEDLVQREGDRPEWNILLASLLEREGKAARARQVLARVQSSPLARAYLARLQNVPDTGPAQPSPAQPSQAPTRENIATPAQRAANNPARSAAADARLAHLEKLMLEMVNNEREQRNLRAYEWSGELAEVARAHSVEMRDKSYFAHESPTPGLERPMNRYIAGLGLTPRLVAENIYRSWGTQHQLSQADIEAGHTSLMNSPGHRTNILLPQAQRCGIGIAVNQNGDIWITQMFDRP